MRARSHSHLLDDIGWNIISELQENARIPFSELGRRVGLSTPAVVERVRQMEDAGIIRGFHAEVDPAKLGFGVMAFIRVKVSGGKLRNFAEVIRFCPEALECHRVTGSESFIIKVAVTDINHLESVIDALMPYVATTTSMILSSPLPWSAVKHRVQPPQDQDARALEIKQSEKTATLNNVRKSLTDSANRK
jgi:Lrp/AsnC family transcriptional regulator, leucine-responsive regulatory protein